MTICNFHANTPRIHIYQKKLISVSSNRNQHKPIVFLYYKRTKHTTKKENMSIVQNFNSICIPRIDSTIPKSTIINTFESLNIGNIYRVIEIPFKDSNKYKRIIVKLEWNDSEMSKHILSRFQEGKNVKIVYNFPTPWFWICVPNRIYNNAPIRNNLLGNNNL